MNLADEIAALARQTVPELRERYAALFGEATVAKHKMWLVKRIAWRLQAVAEGETDPAKLASLLVTIT